MGLPHLLIPGSHFIIWIAGQVEEAACVLENRWLTQGTLFQDMGQLKDFSEALVSV